MDRLRTIQHDFKSQLAEPEHTSWISHHHLLTLAGLMLGIGIMIGIVPDNAGATRGSVPSVLDPLLPGPVAESDAMPSEAALPPEQARETGALSAPEEPVTTDGSAPGAAMLADDPNWRTVTVKPGDNLSLIFDRNGLSPRELYEVTRLGAESRALTRIYPGKTLRLLIDEQGRLEALAYDVSESRTLQVRRAADGFAANTIEHQIESRVAQAGGTIHDSLFLTAARAGLSDKLTMELAGIFGWDIDFSLDIRSGDRFSVIYEELYHDGERLGDGRILAAEFVNRGKRHRAIRYTDADQRSDYYSPNGKSMRKTFLRSPVDFTRVSSRFNLNRRHPILNTIRAHRGVDYAAPSGTPVRATGDGKIVSRGANGGYGRTIVVQHGSRYSTLYAHLSGYARGIRPGKVVKQGQTIGYVGMTGLATGPHLHYEFRLDGVHRNPLTVKLPDAEPLPSRFLADFQEHARPLLAQLDDIERMHAALPAEDGTQTLDAGPVAFNSVE